MVGFADKFNATADKIIMQALGDEIVFISADGTVAPIKAVFEAEYYQADVGAGAESFSPAVICNVSDVPNFSQDGKVVVKNVSYEIVNSRPTGDGQVVLILQLAE